MLTYTPPEQRPIQATHEKPLWLLLLLFAWLWPGVFSHDLWKPDEPYVHAATQALLNSQSWLVSTTPFSPIYLWFAAGFEQLLSPHWADSYSAMRFASVFFTAIGLVSCGMAGFHLLGKYQGRSVILILIGCAGLIETGHLLSDMSVQFAALGLMLYALSLAYQKRSLYAAILLSISWTFISLSAGLLVMLTAVCFAFSLLLAHSWQTREFRITLLLSVVIALPLVFIYPLALHHYAPHEFFLWRTQHLFGSFGGTHHWDWSFNPWYYLKNLLWFAFPALPLALWTIQQCRLHTQAWGVLAKHWLIFFGIIMVIQPNTIRDSLIWFMPALALLGAAKLDQLRRGAAAFLNWFGIATFGLFALCLWIGFFAINFGSPAWLADYATQYNPDYIPDIDIMPMLVALSFTPLWLWAITRKHIKGRQAVTNWAAGVTLTWALLMTLFLPWLDAIKSYRPIVQKMAQALPQSMPQNACLHISSPIIQLAWQEHQPHAIPLANQASCTYILLQTQKNHFVPSAQQTIIWQGSRPQNDNEWFVLIQQSSQSEKVKP